jgi:acyl carrier protein
MAAVFGIAESDITEDASPDTIEAWDSLRHMSLVLALEEEFGVEFTDDQTVEMLNIKLIKAILSEHAI